MANSYFAKVLSFRQASIGLSASVSRSVSAKSDATQTNIKPQISASASDQYRSPSAVLSFAAAAASAAAVSMFAIGAFSLLWRPSSPS